MKKLSAVQWFAFLAAVVGLVMESGILGDSVIVNEVLGKVLIVLGLAKTVYDLYVSYGAQDVADFANSNPTGEVRKSGLVTKADVKAWARLK